MESTLVLPTPEISPVIIHKHKNNNIIDTSIYDKFFELKNKVLHFKTNDYLQKIQHLENTINHTNYLFKIFGVESSGNYVIHKGDSTYEVMYHDDAQHKDIHNTKKKKSNWFINGMVGPHLWNVIKEMNYCDSEQYMYKYHLKTISLLFDYLNIGGNYFHGFMVICKTQQIQLIYLLSYLFKKIIIYDGIYLICQDFIGEQYIQQTDIELLTDFTITSFECNDKLNDYLKHIYSYYIKLYTHFLNHEIDEYLHLSSYTIYKKITTFDIQPTIKIELFKLIIDTLRRVNLDNQIIKINSAIKSQEGKFISDTIQHYQFKNCLEIGFAFGISAMYILSSSETTKLISIDPFQSTQWNNNGKKLIQELDLHKRHTCVEEKSYLALPKLLMKHQTFDFIFIDGWHTFDYTIVDFFYAFLLLNVGGIIIIDDALHKGVNKCIKYLETNYINCRKLKSPSTIACFKKIKEDTRDWDFHVNF
jgi:predicted O-methyltransferase YrrM